MRTPRVAVIVPAYNSARFLQDSVGSILAQTLDDWEAIVVDDGSTDETADTVREIAATDSRIRVLSKPNGGVSTARNAGFGLLSECVDFVVHLDADDVLEPDALQVLVKTLERHPQSPAVYGLPCAFSADGTVLTKRREDAYGYRRYGFRNGKLIPWQESWPTTFEVLALWPTIATGSIMYRREVLADLPFDERLRMSEDWDVWLRLAARHPIEFLPRFTLRTRQHAASATHNRLLMSSGERIVRTKWKHLLVWTPEQRRLLPLAHRHAALLRLGWAWDSLKRGDVQSGVQGYLRFLQAYRVYMSVQRAL